MENANPETELVMVKHELSDPEKIESSKLLSNLLFDLIELEEEKSAAAADFNIRIKELKKKIRDISEKIRSGFEMIETEGMKVMNYETGRVEYFDLETKDLIKSRRMTHDEKQMQLPVGDNNIE